MIRSLRVENFRGHPAFELNFDGEDQLILISGRNGAGKSSILESIGFALNGVTRHGNDRNLRRLVRWGAEFEGMTVELVFELGGNTYQVVRRYEGREHSAVLYVNDNPVVEGARQVNAEIASILGMDAKGFELAVVARQSELDGLASMTAAERTREISRLLRLDAIGVARNTARAQFRRQRDIAQSLGEEDIADIEQRLATARADTDAAAAAVAASSAALATIDAELAASAGLEAAWVAATTAAAVAAERHSATDAEVNRIRAERDALVWPDEVDTPAHSIDELNVAAGEVERAIAQGEAAAEMAAHRDMVERELTGVRARLGELNTEIDNLELVDVAALRTERDTTSVELDAAAEQLVALREQAAAAKADVARLDAAIAAAAELGATCDRCGQDIDADHAHTQQARLEADRDTAAARIVEVTDTGKALRSTHDTLAATLADLDTRIGAADTAAARRDQLVAEQAELGRRESTYESQLGRFTVVDVDLDTLYGRKAQLAVELAHAAQAAEVAAQRANVQARHDDLTVALSAATQRLATAAGAVTAAEMDTDLVAAWEARTAKVDARAGEADLLAAMSTQHAVATERVDAIERELASATARVAKRRDHERSAVVASHTEKLISEVSAVLSSQIRPALQGSVADLLGRMTEGRYDQVRVDDDYGIELFAGDQWRPLSEFSGGEADLVALAVRLSLAGVVSERHSTGGVGFLILDEVFGSLDGTRRESVLSALRALRPIYGQIFCISHVGGLEDAADVVVAVDDTAAGAVVEVL